MPRLRLGVQSQPDHLESPGSKGKAPRGRMPRARGCDPRSEAEPTCGDTAGPQHGAPRIQEYSQSWDPAAAPELGAPVASP